MLVSRYEEAVKLRQKTPDEIELEMDEPMKANYSQYDYHFPNGITCGIGKSKRPGHAALFQLVVSDFNGKNAVQFPTEYAGEYTSVSRAEHSLRLYCKEAWAEAERLKTKATRQAEAAKEDQRTEMERDADECADASREELGMTKEQTDAFLQEEVNGAAPAN